jgi:hypothetical protein
MYYFGIATLKKDDTYASAPLYIMFPRIFLQMAWKSKVYPDYENPYDTMGIILSLLLKESIERKVEKQHTEHLLGYSGDPSKVANLSWICYAALFSPSNDEAVTAHNLRIARGIWSAIEKNLIRSSGLAFELNSHTYQIGLWLLASGNERVHDDTNTDVSKTILQTPREPILKLLLSMLTFLIQAYGRAYQRTVVEELEAPDKALRYLGPSLRMTLSLAYLSLHFEADNATWVQELKKQVSEMAKLLTTAKREIGGDEFESLMLFAGYLERSGDRVLADELRASIQGKKSTLPYREEYVLTTLEKPLIGFDETTIAEWSAAIFAAQTQEKAAG